jgi:hypothetical protein
MQSQDRDNVIEHRQQLENTDVKDGTFMTQQDRFSPTPMKHHEEPPRENEVIDAEGNQYKEWRPPSVPQSPVRDEPIRVESRVNGAEDGWLYNNYEEPDNDEIEDNYGDDPVAQFETERKENTESPHFPRGDGGAGTDAEDDDLAQHWKNAHAPEPTGENEEVQRIQDAVKSKGSTQEHWQKAH